MQKVIPNVLLRSGKSIPAIGFGTYQMKGDVCYAAVKEALASGYRHIDSASFYHSGKDVSKAIKDSGVKREEIYISSKVAPVEMGFDSAKKACQKILDDLSTSYVDLLLIHWPAVGGKDPSDPGHPKVRVETWNALIELQKEGKVKDIGVSNFLVRHLSTIS